jgi:hypothetical protein
MRYPFYLIYGLMMLGGATVAQYQGWTTERVNQMKNVPKTVRDNPGSFRSHYGYIPHYVGGK